jgi:hypothetical protein
MANYVLTFAPITLLPSPNPLAINNNDTVQIEFPPIPQNTYMYISFTASTTPPVDGVGGGGGTIKVGS